MYTAPPKPPRTPRSIFLTLMFVLTAFVLVETVLPAPRTAEARATEGLSACGSEADPCILAPVEVEAPRDRLANTAPLRQVVRVGS